MGSPLEEWHFVLVDTKHFGLFSACHQTCCFGYFVHTSGFVLYVLLLLLKGHFLSHAQSKLRVLLVATIQDYNICDTFEVLSFILCL